MTMMNEDDSTENLRQGFNVEYESLSDDDEVSTINPFATGKSRSPALVETVQETSSPSPPSRPCPGSACDLSSMPPTNFSSQQLQRQQQCQRRSQNSLLDDSDKDVRMTSNASTPGVAGFLEMEDEPARSVTPHHAKTTTTYGILATHKPYTPTSQRVLEEQEDLIDFTPDEEPIQTSSGLLLTHRRTSAENRASKHDSSHGNHSFPSNYRPSSTRFEVETSPWSMKGDPYGFGRAPTAILQARRMLSFARIWVAFFCIVLLLGTVGMLHSFRHEKNDEQLEEEQEDVPSQIYLLPLNNAAELAQQQREAERAQHRNRRGARKLLSDLNNLRQEFEEWVLEHKRIYHSAHEKERRFYIWKENHFRTLEKNKRHGNCKIMNQPVFGSNFMKDLTPEEFQTQFLTGYNGPNADGHEIKTGRRRQLKNKAPVMHPNLHIGRHPEVHRRILQQWSLSGSGKFTSSSTCDWYDVSCWLRIVFQEYLYVGIGTMEPKYDAETYPKSMDWRDVGAVTSIRRQGDCGACWAITAVETIESAYFIGTGNMVDLSETEVISCTDSCNLCFGGWPQDAYEYAQDHGGLMLNNDWSYNGASLLSLSQQMLSGEKEDEVDSDIFASYISENCPAAQDGSGGNSNSGRYGNIKGYGYATDRCICYSDGSGCDCDNQNEGVAVRNVASYGPATVCLDASVWQDYSGGIITSDSGCSAKFLAMNHCVQVVGYAYNDGSVNDNDEENSHSNSNDSGDGGQRDGYWIVRNQWGSYWGMNGYAYVAMGENTCGILNDMSQAYM